MAISHLSIHCPQFITGCGLFYCCKEHTPMLTPSDNQIRTAVKYNRQAKTWQAINGETQEFGPGKEGKRQALLAALQYDQPRLYEAITDLAEMNGNDPKLLDRLLKGCQLLTKGHVFKSWHKNRYRVRSQCDSETYEVEFGGQPAAYACTCMDYKGGLQRIAGEAQYGGVDVDFNPWPVCKHILACHVAWLTQWPLEDEPIPFDGGES
jgi:hypothetical protein